MHSTLMRRLMEPSWPEGDAKCEQLSETGPQGPEFQTAPETLIPQLQTLNPPGTPDTLTGYYTNTPDGRPLIGPHGCRNFFVCGGWEPQCVGALGVWRGGWGLLGLWSAGFMVLF